MPTSKNSSALSTSDARTQWEAARSEKKRYLKRVAEDVEQADLIEEWLKYKEDDKDGLRE